MSKTDYFGENVRKFLQNKFFWLLSKIESIDVFFPLKYGAVNCVFYDYTKTRCLSANQLRDRVLQLWPKMLSTRL